MIHKAKIAIWIETKCVTSFDDIIGFCGNESQNAMGYGEK